MSYLVCILKYPSPDYYPMNFSIISFLNYFLSRITVLLSKAKHSSDLKFENQHLYEKKKKNGFLTVCHSIHGSYSSNTETGKNSIRIIHKSLEKAAISKLAILLKVYSAFLQYSLFWNPVFYQRQLTEYQETRRQKSNKLKHVQNWCPFQHHITYEKWDSEPKICFAFFLFTFSLNIKDALTQVTKIYSYKCMSVSNTKVLKRSKLLIPVIKYPGVQ